MRTLGKIIKKGTFDLNGMPTGWVIEAVNHPDDVAEGSYNLGISVSGSVLINGIEMVEWTKERQACMRGEQ